MRLTVSNVRSLTLPAGKNEALVFDDDLPGFGLRLRAGGSRTWIFQYAIAGKQRRLTIGKTSAIDFTKAKDTAKNLYAQVRLGGDPAGEKAAAKVQTGETFQAAARAFLERQRGRVRPRTYTDIERHLLVNAKPLHALPLSGVHRRDVATILNAIGTSSGAVTANRLRSTLSAFYAWGLKNGIVEANPVIGTEQRPETSRDRVLSSDELRLIWNALDDSHYGSVVKLLMLTSQRKSEIAEVRWREIDFEAATITLPRERVKNGRQHVIPLSVPALAILRAQPNRPGREMLYGFGSGPLSGWTERKNQLDRRIGAIIQKPLPHWTLHDLRRTAATGMAEIGVQPHVIEAVLNHVSGHKGGVAGIYNRASYEREKREALNLWAEHLLAVVEGRKPVVVPLKRA